MFANILLAIGLVLVIEGVLQKQDLEYTQKLIVVVIR